MPTASAGWEPGRNAVHRLLQLSDALAIALNRFRQRSFLLPLPPDPLFAIERDRLWAEYFPVHAAIFPKADIAPHHTAFRLAIDAVAELVRVGVKDEQPVIAARDWLTAVGWILVPHVYPQWTLSPEAHKRFDEEGQRLEPHLRVRAGLLVALARVGQLVPTHVHQRAPLASHSWSPSVPEPVTQSQLLGWVRETEPTDIPAHAPVAADLLPVVTATGNATEPPKWDGLGEAKQTVLIVLAAGDAMRYKELAKKAGYQPDSLRHHYGALQDWQFIESTKAGYRITPAGRALIPPNKV